MSENKGRPWTEEEIKLLFDLRAQNLRWSYIAERLGRTSKGIQWYYRLSRMSPEKKSAHRANKRASRLRLLKGEPKLANRVEDPRKIPEHTMAEWVSRMSAQRTLSAALLGDPPIGYSALDRRAQS